jgi:diaminopimelate epimerase
MHGTENTFYLVDKLMPDADMKALTISLCEDGSDGVLFVCESNEHLSRMRIFNSDGTEPEMCGNGLRCFSRYILEKHQLVSASIETMNASYDVTLIEEFHGLRGVEVKLYPVKSLNHSELETFESELELNYYTVSNPHVVGFVEQRMSVESLTDIGKRANSHFSEGINVNIVRIIDENKIYVQTFERGVGITKSCGTGMTSSTVHYARRHNKLGKVIEVYNDGGMIECIVDQPDDYLVLFTGNATYLSEHDDTGQLIKTLDEGIEYRKFYKKTRDSI